LFNKKGKFSFIIIGIILVSTIFYKLAFYTPPLLDFEKRNIIEKTIDFFSFGWHFTKASIYGPYLKKGNAANMELGKAGWHRKKYLEKRFGVNGDNLISILKLYKRLQINPILEKLYISLIKEKNVNINILHEAGQTFIINKNWKMAARAFSRLVELESNEPMFHYYLGLCYLNLKKVNKAKDSFKSTIKLEPDFADAYYRLGLIAEKEQDWKKAKKLYEKTISILPNHLESLKALKKVYDKIASPSGSQ